LENEKLMTIGTDQIVWTHVRDISPPDHQQGSSDSSVLQLLWLKKEKDLASLRDLSDNWDGFGAEASNPAVIDKAYHFLLLLKERDFVNPPKRVSLSPDGMVGIEWTEGNSYRRAEVCAHENSVTWMSILNGAPAQFSTEPLEDKSALREQTWQEPPTEVGDQELAYAS
jgi:hypothetical protein